jgi:hypothetical protein
VFVLSLTLLRYWRTIKVEIWQLAHLRARHGVRAIVDNFFRNTNFKCHVFPLLHAMEMDLRKEWKREINTGAAWNEAKSIYKTNAARVHL